jgi:hypothetical protein
VCRSVRRRDVFFRPNVKPQKCLAKSFVKHFAWVLAVVSTETIPTPAEGWQHVCWTGPSRLLPSGFLRQVRARTSNNVSDDALVQCRVFFPFFFPSFRDFTLSSCVVTLLCKMHVAHILITFRTQTND